MRLYSIISVLFMGCALNIETKILDANLWFKTDYYTSIEYCENECKVYSEYEDSISNRKFTDSPFCICMKECTDNKNISRICEN